MNWIQVLVHLDRAAHGVDLNFLELFAESVNIASVSYTHLTLPTILLV